MGADQKDVAARKYNAITKANKIMFGAVALASVVAGATVVGMSFLVQDINFNSKVISKQDETLGNIKKSVDSIEGQNGLKTKIKGLQTDQNLLSSRASDEDNALRVILDALPSDANATAVAASLSDKILKVDNLTLESMNLSLWSNLQAMRHQVKPLQVHPLLLLMVAFNQIISKHCRQS